MKKVFFPVVALGLTATMCFSSCKNNKDDFSDYNAKLVVAVNGTSYVAPSSYYVYPKRFYGVTAISKISDVSRTPYAGTYGPGQIPGTLGEFGSSTAVYYDTVTLTRPESGQNIYNLQPGTYILQVATYQKEYHGVNNTTETNIKQVTDTITLAANQTTLITVTPH